MTRRRVAVRGALATLALVLGPAALAAQDGAARSRAPSVAILGAMAITSPLLTDGNGTRVRLAPAPLVGARATLGTVGGTVHPTLTLRVGASGIRLRSAGARWSAGQALQADLLAGAEWQVQPRATARAAVGVVWLAGPRDVAPFQENRTPRAAAEVGTTLRWRPRSRTALELAAEAFRVSPEPGSAGGVVRVLLGISRAL